MPGNHPFVNCKGPDCDRIFGRMATAGTLGIFAGVSQVVENSEEHSPRCGRLLAELGSQGWVAGMISRLHFGTGCSMHLHLNSASPFTRRGLTP